MLVGYARVSTAEQCLDRQIDSLTAAGVDARNIYKEAATGTKSDRPELSRMVEALKRGDTVVVAELTRVSRSTKELLELVERIESKGANIKSLYDGWLDTTTPQGRLIFTIMAGINQFERDLISQRTKDGLKAARARGRSGGRPSKRNEKAATVELLYNNGVKIADIARQMDLSRSTVNRIIQDMKAGGRKPVGEEWGADGKW